MRLKDVVELVNEKTDRVERPYVALENIVSWEAKFVATNAVTEGTNACFKAGDVLFGKLRPYLAKGYLPDYDGICSTEFLVMRPRRDINGRYILYWMLSPDFISVIKNRVAGVKMPRTDWATISQMELTLPGLDSQRKLVAYLDEKSAAIDARVAVLEKKLAAYKRLKTSIINRAVTRGLDPKAKLKDSGVEWIGKVPAGWEAKRAKDLFKKEQRPIRSTDEIITAFRDGQVTLRKNRRLTGFTEATNYDTYQGIRKGDLVIHQMDAFAGCAGISDSDGMGSPILSVCTPKDKCEVRYYAEIVRLMGRSGYISSLARGIRERSADFRFELFAMQLLPYPPPAEQIAIADYLDSECAKIDKMAELVTREIELYKKLKRSLINEVVTGKRPVFAGKPLRRGKEVSKCGIL